MSIWTNDDLLSIGPLQIKCKIKLQQLPFEEIIWTYHQENDGYFVSSASTCYNIMLSCWALLSLLPLWGRGQVLHWLEINTSPDPTCWCMSTAFTCHSLVTMSINKCNTLAFNWMMKMSKGTILQWFCEACQNIWHFRTTVYHFVLLFRLQLCNYCME